MNVLLIDGDYIAHANGFKDTEEEVEAGIESSLYYLLEKLEGRYNLTATHYMHFLSGKNNFRKIISPEYKAKRKKDKPPFFYHGRDYLINEHNAFVCEGVEADDGIVATWNSLENNPFREVGSFTIIASVDKDFKQIPCLFYDMWSDRDELYSGIKTIDTLKRFDPDVFKAYQMLVGDSVDGVVGVKGVGKRNKDVLRLGEVSSTLGLNKIVISHYKRVYGSKWREKYILNKRLLEMVTDGIEIPKTFNEL